MVRNNTKQAGVASITVVIFMSIILTIVTIGFIRIAVNESRNSTDEDLTSRAYYAAESGVEDAKRAISANLATGIPSIADLHSTECQAPQGGDYNPVLSPPSEFDIEYTCMLIDYTPGAVQVNLSSANQVKQIAVKPINSIVPADVEIGTITLTWHMDTPIVDGGNGNVSTVLTDTNIRPAGEITLPDLASWNFPAMMEVTFISHPSGSFSRGDIKSATVLVSPNSGAGTATVYDAAGLIRPSVDGSVVPGACSDNNGNMACSMTFDVSGLAALPTPQVLDLRIANSYAPTSFNLTMMNLTSDSLLFGDVQAVVDVTGRAGEVYRRVEAALDLSSPNLLPDYAIQSATDICKDFTFTNVRADFDGVGSTSCTR